MNNTEANKRIAKNAMLLYLRMGVMMIISFFTARITLEAFYYIPSWQGRYCRT